MESELELNDTIQEMHVISTRPELYSILIETNCIQYLLGLLNHENIDISVAVISLLQELTDFESAAESLDEFQLLINSLVKKMMMMIMIMKMNLFCRFLLNRIFLFKV